MLKQQPELIIRYADLRTIRILARSNHLRVSIDDAYVLDCFKEDLRLRPGVSDELVQAFDGLLEIIKQAPFSNVESRAGCLGSVPRDLNVVVPLKEDVDSGSEFDGEFEDAVEQMEPMMKEIHHIARGRSRMKTW